MGVEDIGGWRKMEGWGLERTVDPKRLELPCWIRDECVRVFDSV